MKKILVVAALFASMAAANAQQFGVIGGMTSSKINTSEEVDAKNMTLYHAGVLYKADLGAGFALQPALTYQVKGGDFERKADDINKIVKSKTGFAELSLGIQWGIDLLAFRPFVFAEPFVGYHLTGEEIHQLVGSEASSSEINKALNNAKNSLEYGFGLGGGLEITSHIQLSCQFFKNLGSLYDQNQFNEGDLKAIQRSYKDIKNYQGIKFSLAILF